MKTMLLLMTFAILGLVGCEQKGSTDSTKEKAQAEEEASTNVQNKNQAQKAAKMEADLNAQHQFYNAVEGEYQGKLVVDGESFNINIVLVRSIPQFKGDRVRELSEIEFDLNNLFFQIRVTQWHPSDTNTAVSCPVSLIKPSWGKGQITVASPECKNFYSILLNELSLEPNLTSEQRAMLVSQKISEGTLGQVDSLAGSARLDSNAGIFPFLVNRVK